MQREVWFEKIGWSYMPCHWKGWAILLAFIIPAALVILFAQSMLDAAGYGNADPIAFAVIFLPVWLSLLHITKRHS